MNTMESVLYIIPSFKQPLEGENALDLEFKASMSLLVYDLGQTIGSFSLHIFLM